MKQLHKSQSGFGIVEIFIVIVIIGLFTGAGWFVYRSQQDKSSKATASTQTFASGIYYRQPNLNDPSAFLRTLDNNNVPSVRLAPVDFDIRPDKLVYADNDTLMLVAPDGKETAVKVKGLYQMARPSFSPDGSMVAVQATDKPQAPEQAADPKKLGIYLITLGSGSVRLISNPDSGLPAESPVWFHTANKVAYSTFSSETGVDIHIYDVDARQEAMVIEDAGWLHLAITPDDKHVLNVATLKLYDLVSGELVGDLKQKAESALQKAGYNAETKTVGDLGSSFPLDGGFSPDGTSIVFDGAVEKDGKHGSITAKMKRDGTGFEVLTDLHEINSDFSNGNNFSQVNVTWL